MQIAPGVDGLSPEVHWGLRIEHHSPGLLGQDSNHPFRDAVLVLRMWRTWLECNTSDGEDALEWCSGALDWNADYLPFELCLDAYLADVAVIDVTFDNRLYCCFSGVTEASMPHP